MNTKNTHRGAFTLIELLVVIAIISLLVSILLPSLQAAKELARTSKCLSTLRSLGLGLQMYAGENNGYITADFSDSPLGFYQNRQSWPWQLAPYLDMGIMRTDDWGNIKPYGIIQLACPSADPIVAGDAQFHAGYSTNLVLDRDRWNTGSETYTAPPQIETLAGELVYLGDGTLLPIWNAIAGITSRSYTNGGFTNEDYDGFHFPAYRHNGGVDQDPTEVQPDFQDTDSANFVFIGGHAENVQHAARENLWIDPSNH
jgi:prepilin-type N-terminal cleavage/methylation domain-containing protein